MSRRFAVSRSTVIAGLEWLGAEIPYEGMVDGEQVKGDTFPMTFRKRSAVYAMILSIASRMS